MSLSALHHAPLGVGTVRRPAPTTQMQSAIGFRARSCAEAWTLRNCEAIHAIEAVVSKKCDVNEEPKDRLFDATEADEGRPLDVGWQKQASNQAVRLGFKRPWS
jgi:hypothetical protein